MPDDNTAVTSSTSMPDPASPVLPTVSVPEPSSATDQTLPPVEPAPTELVPTEPTPTDAAPAEPAPAPEPAVPESPVVDPTAPPAEEPEKPQKKSDPDDKTSLYPEIAAKVRDSRNVLIALSSDPSVDEMCAAIGLSLYLDRLGKRATAIYSGATPNALEFLKPEETFESTADTLQDFVIALNKEKADHLRYKLDGDFVKIYITPYKTRISEEDLDFSYGDYNVDLVLALDVANGIDLDSALREHGRIMHDAVIVNITTGKPGKFGEIEWSDKSASSVSEMVANLLYHVNSDIKIEKEEATAFLTGIVAATNRFSSASTTPDTMQVASKLMESGANQQLVSKNITPDVDNQLFSLTKEKVAESERSDPTKLEIQHEGEPKVDEGKEVGATVTEKAHTLLDDLKAAEESLATAGAETTPVADHKTLKIDSATEEATAEAPIPEEKPAEEPAEKPAEEPSSEPETISKEEEKPAEEPAVKPTEEPAPEDPSVPILEAPKFDDFTTDGGAVAPDPEEGIREQETEKVIQPSADFDSGFVGQEPDNKYGHMLEDALNSLNDPAVAEAPIMSSPTDENPAAMTAPAVASNPEINGVPEMNYMPMPGEEILPPPPTPEFDPTSMTPPTTTMPPIEPIAPAFPAEEATPPPLGPQPAMQDQVYNPQTADPSAFKIPGM